ncbi:hypothetical protein BD310DRAFT_918289 [Dichomitus squalens]|uniref:Uncharacterized protein n=1 Tax=Dichomitus squalens TaxID=114155 RepID=A0A4V2K985_9APHY|nr:hypothetical protein BD310DRAFT_918289 [Dichomitus squalens]
MPSYSPLLDMSTRRIPADQWLLFRKVLRAHHTTDHHLSNSCAPDKGKHNALTISRQLRRRSTT